MIKTDICGMMELSVAYKVLIFIVQKKYITKKVDISFCSKVSK